MFLNIYKYREFYTSIQLIFFFLGNLLKPVKTTQLPNNTWDHLKIKFGGIPNNRNILFYKSFKMYYETKP
jgi:hypothetical protein